MNRRIPIASGVAALALLGLGGTAVALGGGDGHVRAAKSGPARDAQAASPQIRLADATIIIEVNATDGDAGLQVFLDGEPWKAMTISSPDGRKLLDVDAVGRLKNFGLTELFSESNEPPFKEFPLEKFKKLFPEGKYTFVGTTVEGETLTGKARLSHDIPDGPEITSPKEDEEVPRDKVVARWNPVPEPPGIKIVGYRVIVEREHPLRVLSVDLPGSAHSLTIPSEFLKSGVEHKLEIQAIEASGNQTITEITFRVK